MDLPPRLASNNPSCRCCVTSEHLPNHSMLEPLATNQTMHPGQRPTSPLLNDTSHTPNAYCVGHVLRTWKARKVPRIGHGNILRRILQASCTFPQASAFLL